MKDLPRSWAVTPLKDVVAINPLIDKSVFDNDLEVSFVPMPAVEAETGRIDTSQLKKFGEVKKGYTPFQSRDVLFAKITPCMENGKAAVVPDLINGIGFGSTEFHVLRACTGIEPAFLYYFISSKSFRYDAEHNMTGAVGQRRVPTAYLEKSLIMLPPTREQKRIVAKIEELFSELDKGIESLKTAREQLKVYRQAVLKAAFEGKLTEKWREENKDNLEAPSQIFEHVKYEREVFYKQQLRKYSISLKLWEDGDNSAKKPGKPNRLPDVNLLEEEVIDELPKLPFGWAWFALEGVVQESVLGKMLDKEKNKGNLEPYLRNINVRWGTFDLSNLLEMRFEEAEHERYSLVKGDIVICEGGEPGRCAIWKEEIPDIRIQKALHRVRVYHRIITPEYLYYCIVFLNSVGLLGKHFTGTTIKHLTGEGLSNVEIPLCSLIEQQIIVTQIENSFSMIYQLEDEINVALKKLEALRQSILKKAFSGQLVPQDPDDEPASVLLERIRAEKEGQVAQKSAKKVGERPRRGAPLANVAERTSDYRLPDTDMESFEQMPTEAEQLEFDLQG